jgi:hypothetical protein
LITRRPALAYRLHEEDDAIHIRCYGREISIPAFAAAAVQYAMTTSCFKVRDLPSELDEESKLVLVRRLVCEGILMVIERNPR